MTNAARRAARTCMRPLALPLVLLALGGCASARGTTTSASTAVGESGGASVSGGRRGARQEPALSAPVQDVRYEVTYDQAAARHRMVPVVMRFTTAGREPVLLSLPSWTPGAYEVSDFAKYVDEFTVTGDGHALDWDKLDYDTWRVQPAGARAIEVRFTYRGSDFDNAKTWLQPDFAFFNGTNLFLYPEGRPFDFTSTVTVRTAPSWKVATGMMRSPDGAAYAASSYHDLVDHPFFVGAFDFDSVRVNDGWSRVASYPAGALSRGARADFHSQVAKIIPEEARVFGEVAWGRTYTTLLVFDEEYQGGSALEHADSHLGIYTPQFIGNPLLPSITAHEIFHAWNVKRLRPADMVPYRYDVPQPTTLLWMSEGITDYYADLALVRTNIVPEPVFYSLTAGKIDEVANTPAVALEDASLSTWISPVNGTATIYYAKGSLAGLMLDVMIRDASDNRRGLDDVMRELYRATYKAGGQGFTNDQFWAAVSSAAGGRSFADFYHRYIDGRDPYPWETLLPLAGMRLRADTTHMPSLGVGTRSDSTGAVEVMELVPDGPAEKAGVEVGDFLVSVGDIPVTDNAFSVRFRQRYASKGGQPLPIVVRRGGREQKLTGTVTLLERISYGVVADTNASVKAVRIRNGILKGTTDASSATTK